MSDHQPDHPADHRSGHDHHVVRADTVADFLSGRRIAVVGASDDPKNFGRTIYHELREHGYEPVAVHPTATSVDGDACYPDIAAVPGDVDGAIVMVPAARSADVVEQCLEAGVPKVWLFRGIGSAGALSDEAVSRCRARGVPVVEGACPLMFLEPVGWFHRVHRFARRHRGALATADAGA